MASSKTAIFSRKLTPSLLLRNTKPCTLSMNFCTNNHNSNNESEVEREEFGNGADHESPSSSINNSNERVPFYQRPMEKGLDVGVYKAILIGKVGQTPFQKTLKSGRPVTMFSLGTGGIRNNRRPLAHEEPRDYAERCSIQWHRVCVYPGRLGTLATNHVKPGSTIYVEGNLETKIFTDPITGLVRRVREIAIRTDGRLVFLGDGGTGEARSDIKGVGYF